MVTMDRLREEMEEQWREFENEASATMSEGNMANVLGQAWYRTLDSAERSLADQVLAEWVLHGTSRQRLYALSLIWEFQIRTAETALRQLATKLEPATNLSARGLREQVRHVIDALSSGHD